jgi:hypothetical protein
MENDRGIFERGLGKGLLICGCVAAVGVAAWAIWGAVAPSGAAEQSRRRVFVCAETGKGFPIVLEPGMSIPYRSPFSGKDTGFPAELCFWTADGKVTDEPTPVLMNVFAGKDGPTFCPDCDRLVVSHNPRPGPGATPPPKREASKAQQQPQQPKGRDGSQ